MNKILSLGFVISFLGLAACGSNHNDSYNNNRNDNHDSKATQNQANQQTTTEQAAAQLAGCYTLNHNEPAQIKINQAKDGFNMQMREPASAVETWDKPEPLTVLDIHQGWEYFKVNTLDLTQDDVSVMLGRADGMMVLAKIKDSAKNINPRLDSSYVMYIVQGSNTVYQVPCD